MAKAEITGIINILSTIKITGIYVQPFLVVLRVFPFPRL